MRTWFFQFVALFTGVALAAYTSIQTSVSTVPSVILDHIDDAVENSAEGKVVQVTENVPAGKTFLHGFVASLSMVLVSELGDKTFFIATIMSMNHSRIVVFAGAMGALLLMTVLSALFGYSVQIIPRVYVVYASALLFLLFGLKMLYSAYYMSSNAATEEMEEAQAEIKKREAKMGVSKSPVEDLEKGLSSQQLPEKETAVVVKMISSVFAEAFILTFLAEWGDRSQIATVILAAKHSVFGVIVGGSLGHLFCTGLAVLGGRLVSQRISVKNVTLIGGIVFLIFAITTVILEIPNI